MTAAHDPRQLRLRVTLYEGDDYDPRSYSLTIEPDYPEDDGLSQEAFDALIPAELTTWGRPQWDALNLGHARALGHLFALLHSEKKVGGWKWPKIKGTVPGTNRVPRADPDATDAYRGEQTLTEARVNGNGPALLRDAQLSAYDFDHPSRYTGIHVTVIPERGITKQRLKALAERLLGTVIAQ